jgi:hypothetical protein
MADQQLQTVLNSGGITSVYLGGTTTADKVLKKSEVDAFDNSATSLLATTQQAALVELANVGLAHMLLATPYTAGQTIGLTPSKISLFDTIHHDINGAVTPLVDTSEAIPAHKYTIDKIGLYAIYGTVSAEFASSDAVSMQLYKNAAPIGVPVSVQGRGAGKPVVYAYNDLLDLVATDYLEVYAYSDAAATSTVIKSSSMIVERKPLS